MPAHSDASTLATREWWRSAVIYQIYPRSFSDANGDGIGDLPGILEHLDYVHALGVDAIWLSPFFRSPQADSGYDISDFRDVDELFGSLSDFDCLLTRAHELELRVVVDLVPNHTSSAHPWFRAALSSAPGSVERARYQFRDGRGEAGSTPPNNWQSLFSGPAWTRLVGSDGVAEQWYLHLFDSSQPDLNWDNPDVRVEFESILRFWLDRGVDGFRVDVARGLVKAPGLPDYPIEFQSTAGGGADGSRSPLFDQPGVHEIYRRWRQIVEEYDGDRILVAEAHVEPPARLARYVRPDEMHQAFNFEYLSAPYSAAAIRRVIDRSLTAYGDVGAPATWVLNNHDDVRHLTRLATGQDGRIDIALGLRRAKTTTAVMLALPGTAYIYQGEELGLPEHLAIPAAARRDPTFARSAGELLGRDGCRVPLPWLPNIPSYGFSPTGTSWLPQPPEWSELSVQRQADNPVSTLSFYRTAIAARRDHGLGHGALRWNSATGPEVLDFSVGEVRVIANLGTRPIARPHGAVVLSTALGEEDPGHVPPDSALWIIENSTS